MSTLFITAVFLLVRLMEFADLILKAGIEFSLFLQLLGIIFLTLLVMTVPMAVLLGTIIGVGRLTNENEILAMRVGGINIGKIFLPVLAAGVVLSMTLMVANQYMIPAIFRKVDQMIYQVTFDGLQNLKEGIVYDNLGPPDADMTFYFEERLERERDEGILTIGGVNIRVSGTENKLVGGTQTGPDINRTFMIFAESGEISGDPVTSQINLKLLNGICYPPEESGSKETTIIEFEQMEFILGDQDPDLAKTTEISPREKSFPDLRASLMDVPDGPVIADDDEGRRIRRVWKNYFTARNEMIQRFTLPISAFAFLLIGIPLAIEVRPRAKTFSVIIAALLIAAYYGLFVLAQNFGASGGSTTLTISMFLLPNIVLGLAGLWMMWRAVNQ